MSQTESSAKVGHRIHGGAGGIEVEMAGGRECLPKERGEVCELGGLQGVAKGLFGLRQRKPRQLWERQLIGGRFLRLCIAKKLALD